MSGHGFPCPKCGSADIRRSRPQTFFELPKMLVGVYPFRCVACNERFSRSIWMLATRGYVNCPRCLRLDVAPSVKRDSHLTRHDRFMLSIGSHMYRCVPCRLNFFSFRKCIHGGNSQPNPAQL